jgi:outer membrane lipoprotein carrier protein
VIRATRARLLAGLAATLLLALASPARALTVDGLLAGLDRQAASVSTLSGEFTQTSRVKLFRQELKSRGRLYFKKPRQVRWEYLDPDPSRLVIDGNEATLSSPGAPSQKFDLAKDATMRVITDQLFLWLGSGSIAQAKEQYTLAVSGTDDKPVLVLTPKPDSPTAKAFTRIELRLDKQLLLRGILLKEASGDEKEIVFDRLERNAKLPADAFKP